MPDCHHNQIARTCAQLFCCLAVFLLTGFNPMASPAHSKTIVIYPRASENDARALTGQKFIELALQKTEGAYDFQISSVLMERKRMEHELLSGDVINAYMMPKSIAYDDRYIRIDPAIDKGLIGKRVILTRQDKLEKFRRIENLTDLKAISFVSGNNWVISDIMEKAGLNVTRWPDYTGMFALISAGRVDAFSRGAQEATQELSVWQEKYPFLVVEPTLLIQNDLAVHIYVSPARPDLAERLSQGLARAGVDGSFEATYEETFAKGLESLRLADRRQIWIDPGL